MRTVDLFAGCGGLSKGFENAGFDIVGAFENWSIAAECYHNNFSHPVYETDLSDTDNAIKLIYALKPELIIGGPPCQDFSHAGKRIEANRASLTLSYAKIISKIKPPYFVMENVDRAQKSDTYKQARAMFKAAGFGLTETILDASLCGVPQKRKRFICIGILNGADDVLKETITSKMNAKSTTLRDYFGNTLDFEFYYRHPRNYNRRAIFSIDEPSPTIRGVNRPVPKGYQGHPNDACELNDNIRALTTLERSLIQTFPPEYKWIGSKTEIEQMIGNAVPVKLAEYVANLLKEYINSNKLIQINQFILPKDKFRSWLNTNKCYAARSISDIISRTQRAFSLQSPSNCVVDDYYLFELERNPSYKDLSNSVKSQIKRAIMLYKEFSEQVVITLH